MTANSCDTRELADMAEQKYKTEDCVLVEK